MRYYHLHTTITEDRSKPESQTDDRIRCLDADTGSLTVEQFAYALSQITAARILPPLIDLPCGTDLLNYEVDLRDQLGHILLRELALVLGSEGSANGWVQISQYAYLRVIGAGVAAHLDITPWHERLTLRMEDHLANEFFHAGRAPDLPRSRLFLQANLYESIDRLLACVRMRSWHWVAT